MNRFNRLKKLSFLLALTLGSTFTLQAHAQLSTYTTTKINLPGSWDISIQDINNNGVVLLSSNSVSYTYNDANNQVRQLGTLGGTDTTALAINNSNQITGRSYLPGNAVYHAFIETYGSLTDIGPSTSSSAGLEINDLGQVIGYDNSGYFLFDNGTKKRLASLPDSSPVSAPLTDINSAGDIIGTTYLPSSGSHATLYTNGVPQDLGTLPGDKSSNAIAINDAGQIVGQSYSNQGKSRVFTYQTGLMSEVEGLGLNSSVNDINSSGQFVGSMIAADNSGHGYIYSEGSVWDLNDLIERDSDNASLLVMNAASINDLGWIGATTWQNGVYGNYLLKPTSTIATPAVPLPASLWFLLSGISLFGMLKRLKK